ncbi:MAG TPA: glycosyltransferase, partial [Daejeonella sp.]|nr:glycosyltransferase [Daejeonella sp.]
MKEPLVSIGMPAYNGEKWIRRALDSLLLQDYPNTEIIISDNLSTDRTLDICAEYAATSNKIRIIKQPVTIGIVENFRVVLTAATGKYFMWAAVDDKWDGSFVRAL